MIEIKYIKRKDLNILKYDNCIKNSVNSRIYAYSWYLDSVADNWDVLIYGDYEIVMPLPWRKKYLISYIYTPAWVQQLGVFSEEKLSENQIKRFLDAIPSKFKKISLMLNEQNKMKNKLVLERTNYILNLEDTQESISNNYKKNRNQALNKALEFETQIKMVKNPIGILKIHRNNILPKVNLTSYDYENLELLLSKLTVNKEVYYYESWHNELILGGAIFLADKNRLYYLLSAVNEKGKIMQSMSVILNTFIMNHCNSKYIFDFEGSTIPGIASFFKSFGAKKVSYFFYHKPFKLF